MLIRVLKASITLALIYTWHLNANHYENDNLNVKFLSSEYRYQITIYSDFYCPHCRKANIQLRKALRKNPKFFSLKTRYLPSIEPDSHELAKAAICVESIGTIEQFTLFKNRLYSLPIYSGITANQRIDKALASLDITAKWLRSCMLKRTTLDRLDADIASATELGFDGTPGYVIADNQSGKKYFYQGANVLVFLRKLSSK